METVPEEVYKSAADLDKAILYLCSIWAGMRSKDPRTKVGACVYDPQSGSMAFGYNGFPKGVPDLKAVWDVRDNEHKYAYVVHAEVNAIAKARMVPSLNLQECILYVTHFPCHHCMKDAIIPSGLRTVKYCYDYPDDPLSKKLATYAGVQLIRYEGSPHA